MKSPLKLKCLSIIATHFLCLSCSGQKLIDTRTAELKAIVTSEEYPNIDAVIISQKDSILFEEYFNGFERDSLHDTRSAFKSVTSLLAGIAVDQGLFTVNDEVREFITEWKDDPRGNITVKNLLEMKSGLACEGFFDIGPDCESEMWETDDWLSYILNIPLRHQPGLNWAYTSMEPELVGIIISRTSGMTLIEFAKQHLFKPIGMESYQWYITPDGRGYAAGSFYMRPLDMLKLAQLVQDKGIWRGQRIVGEEWINESTNCEIDVEMSFTRFSRTQNAKYVTAKYGYFWYRERLTYKNIETELLFASGNGGQYMMVLEDYNAAIVFTGSNFGNWRGKLPFDILLKYIMPLLEK